MGSVPENAEIFGKLWQDFDSKLNLTQEDAHQDNGSSDEEEEFSFASAFPAGSPVSADDIFKDGQIRPLFPLFNRDLLFSGDSKEEGTAALRPPFKKLFVSNSSGGESLPSEAEGPCCEWRGKAVEEASPEVCRKSSSTGFSKLWRVRDRVVRSSSDGKDAFVFLNNSHSTPSLASSKKQDNKTAERVVEQQKKKVVAQKKGKRGESASMSAHEKHYTMNRARKEGDKRKSYLPYKQDLVGFFANVNGFSRNVHPF